jgi:hypothetical protein
VEAQKRKKRNFHGGGNTKKKKKICENYEKQNKFAGNGYTANLQNSDLTKPWEE